jgi:hypothetical protein
LCKDSIHALRAAEAAAARADKSSAGERPPDKRRRPPLYRRALTATVLLATTLLAGTARTLGGAAEQGGPSGLVTFQGVAQLVREGVGDDEIIKLLRDAPATAAFTLSADQISELRRLGASPRLLDALRKPTSPAARGSEIGDFVIVLDCSGSMKERTPEGPTKMEAAKRVVADFIRDVPDGKRLALVAYGARVFPASKSLSCQCVDVVQGLSTLDAKQKERLALMISKFQPVGATPLALALETAGRQLERSEGLCQLVLITDGMETCDGDPVRVAQDLVRRLSLPHGVDVVGFGTAPQEKKALREIVAQGKGHFYDAGTADELGQALARAGRDARERAAGAARAAGDRLNGAAGRYAAHAAEAARSADEERRRLEEAERLRVQKERQEADERARRLREAERTDDPLIALLVEHLKDRSPAVRAQAARAIKELADDPEARAAVPSLLRLVAEDVDAESRCYFNEYRNKDAALEALMAVATEKVKATLLDAARSKSDNVKQWAVEKLTQRAD